jgi:competence protein ComEC
MSLLYKFPFVRISLIYIVSLLFIDFEMHSIINYFNLVLGFLLALNVLGIILFKKFSKFGNLWIWGAFCLIILFCTGLINGALKDERLKKSHWVNKFSSNNKPEVYLLKIIENPLKKGRWIRTCSIVEGKFCQSQFSSSCGKILVYFPKEELGNKEVKVGDRILVVSEIQGINGPFNPYGFDPKSYYANLQIYGQIKIRKNGWRWLSEEKSKGVHYWANLATLYLEDIFNKGGLKGNEFAVATALVFGLRNDMDSAIVSAFSASGAMHILSVSGMHVGMIFLALEFLLKFMNRTRLLKVFKLLIILITIWIYSIISGLSPSVIRASLMLTFVILGELIEKKGSPLNTVCLSAFLLVFWDPGLIKNVGFQLSFAAVIGIVLWYKDLFSFFDFKSRVFEWLWSVSAVSLTATISTLPLCLYYFNQFPNYFLLSNYLVIPISNLVVYLGISLSLLGWNPFCALLLGKALNRTVWFLNSIVFVIQDLPGSLTTGIYLFPWEVVVLYCFLIVFVFWLYRRNYKVFQVLIVLFVLIQLIEIIHCNSKMSKPVVVFYKTNDGPIVHFLNKGGEQVIKFGHSDTISRDLLKTMEGVSSRFEIKKAYKSEIRKPLENPSGWVYLPFAKARVLFVNRSVKVRKPLPLYIDVLFLGKSVWLEGLSNLNRSNVGLVVLENGMPKKSRSYFQRIFKDQSTRVIDLSEGGYLVYLK